MLTLTTVLAKGGVGKTHVTVHHAVGLAAMGKRTLLVDMDVQGDATQWLLGALPPTAKGVADAIRDDAGVQPGHLHAAPGRKHLTVLPRTPALTLVEHELMTQPGGSEALRVALESVAKDFDFCVIDTGPNMGLLTVNGLVACDAFVVPVEPADLSLAGLTRLDEMLSRMWKRTSSPAELLGYILMRADSREAITAEVRDVLEERSPGKVYKAAVRTNTLAKSLMSRRATFLDDGADEKGAADYGAVLKETLARLSKEAKPSKKKTTTKKGRK